MRRVSCWNTSKKYSEYNVGLVPAKRVLAVVNDLFFSAKISETAKHTGAAVVFATNAADAIAKAGDAGLIVIDLNFSGIAPLELIRQLKSDPVLRGIRLVGFLSHVQVDLMHQAEAAGCDGVMPRSAFSKNLADILA